MNIALVGYGKMGKEVEKVAASRKHTIVARIDPTAEGCTAQNITLEALRNADVVIDFTHPSAAIENARKIASAGKNMVMGTTGWYDKEREMSDIAEKGKIGFVYSSNFSIGVNAFFSVVEHAAKIFNKLDEYDIYGYELHHNQKADSPSGTAVTLGNIIIDNIQRKSMLITERLERAPKKEELHFGSVRAGSIPGTHVVGFESATDFIELKHEARSRQGFALGAVLAAEWVQDKKGFFTIKDFMASYFA
jgi:4-hydroxy-tetrahydrodipicolinate reductase